MKGAGHMKGSKVRAERGSELRGVPARETRREQKEEGRGERRKLQQATHD